MADLHLDELRRELEHYQPLEASLELELTKPLRSLEVGLPEAAVGFVGVNTERLLKRLWTRFGVPGDPSRKTISQLMSGVQTQITSPVALQAFRDIQTLRNRAAHDGHAVDDDDALHAIHKLLALLDWVRTTNTLLSTSGVRVGADVEERLTFLSGLFDVMEYRLAKRFDLSESTSYLLFERQRGLKIDYVELIVGNDEAELRRVIAATGGDLLLTDHPKRTRFLIVQIRPEPARQPTGDERLVVYDEFIADFIDFDALRSRLPAHDGTGDPLSGGVLTVDPRTGAFAMRPVPDVRDHVRDAVATSQANVFLTGEAASGKSTVLRDLLDPGWRDGPPFRILIDLADHEPGESLADTAARQIGPYMRCERAYVHELLLYIIRSGKALCLIDSLDERLAGADEGVVASFYFELCEFFSSVSLTIAASRLPPLVESPWLRQLLDKNALMSEQLRTDLRDNGVDHNELPAFSVLKIDSRPAPGVDDTLASLVRAAAGGEDGTARAAVRSILGLVADRMGADLEQVVRELGSRALAGDRSWRATELARLWGPGFLGRCPDRAAGVLRVDDAGRVHWFHRIVEEALAAAAFVELRGGTGRPCVRLPSEMVRRFVWLLGELPNADDGRLDDNWCVVGPVDELVVARAPSASHIALRPVLVGTYRRFLEEADDACVPEGAPMPRPLEPMWDRLPNGWYRDRGYDGHPAVGISWWGASAYARWVGGRLPSSLEWEVAARGSDGRLFPWGDQADVDVANCADHWAGRSLAGYEAWKRAVDDGALSGRATPPGAFPGSVSACGAWDMAGNVWEWTSTVTADGRAVMAGGSYDNPIRAMRASTRGVYQRSGRSNAVGFRVLWGPE